MIDYIFYRVYWAYNKKRESAKFLSPLYMAMVFAFLFFPFALFLCELLRNSYHRNDGYLLSIYLLMILIYSYLRFFPNKKIWLINKKFEGNGYNYKIPDLCFFVVLPLSIVWGIIIGGLALSLVISIWGNLTQWREYQNWEEADLKYRVLKMVLPSDDPNILYVEKYFSICRDENVINNVRNRVAVYEDSVRRHHEMIEMAAYKDSIANKLLEESNVLNVY